MKTLTRTILTLFTTAAIAQTPGGPHSARPEERSDEWVRPESRAATAAQNAGVRLPDYQEITLSSGATILLMEKHDVPIVAFQARLRGGGLADPAGKDGLAGLVAELIQKGAGKRDAVEFAQAVDRVGGRLGAASTAEAIVASGDFLARDADLMIELLADMLRRPALPEEEFEKLRRRMIEEIAAAKDSDPRVLIDIYYHGHLFGEHPYARALAGSESTLEAIRYDDARRFYDSHFGGDRLILALAGDFSTKTMAAKLRRAFGDWEKADARVPVAKAPSAVKGRRVLLVDKPGATQTYFMIGNVGVSRTDPDAAAIDLVNTVFGGRFTSMLNDALRVKSGLTYGARSVLVRPAQPGSVAISTYTKTESTAEAVDMSLDLLAQLREKGIDATMLDSAKAYALGQFPPSLETNAQLAGRLAELELYGLDRADVDQYGAKVSAATGDDLRRVIARVYPSLDNLTFVFLGDAEKIRDVVKKYGKVTEMKITDPRFTP